MEPFAEQLWMKSIMHIFFVWSGIQKVILDNIDKNIFTKPEN